MAEYEPLKLSNHRMSFKNDEFEVTVKANIPDERWAPLVAAVMGEIARPSVWPFSPLTDEERELLMDEYQRSFNG